MAIDRVAANGSSLGALRPVSGNITQSGYAIGGLCSFVAFRTLLQNRARLDVFCNAVLLLAVLNCAAAALNLAEFHLGVPSVLQYVRTGGYANLDNYEMAGLMRIQGTFSETSAFSGFSVPLFAFTFKLWLDGRRGSYAGPIAAATCTLLIISTSTTAYAGLVIYLAGVGATLVVRAVVQRRFPRWRPLLLAGSVLLVLLVALVISNSARLKPLEDVFDVAISKKLDSSSGIERNSWNRQALYNVVETYGLGVGLGSSRASSYPLVLLSNLGVAGVLLFGAFLSNIIRGGDRSQQTNPVSAAARQAVLASLICASISATVLDLGVLFYGFAAASSLGNEGSEPSASLSSPY